MLGHKEWPYRSTRTESRTHQEAILAQFGKVAKGHALQPHLTCNLCDGSPTIKTGKSPASSGWSSKLYILEKMKAAFVLFAIAGLASAETMFDALPECSHDCLTKAIKGSSSCKPEDNDCLCEVENYRNIYTGAQACVLQACGAAKSVGKSTYLSLIKQPPLTPSQRMSSRLPLSFVTT